MSRKVSKGSHETWVDRPETMKLIEIINNMKFEHKEALGEGLCLVLDNPYKTQSNTVRQVSSIEILEEVLENIKVYDELWG